MKCRKLTFISPLHGSVQCEDIISEGYGRIDFGPEGVYSLCEREADAYGFLDNLVEELTDYVPTNLKELIVKATFGKYQIIDDSIYLVTEIHVRQEPTPDEQDSIKEWIIGQLSDGWGEGVEQNEALVEKVEVQRLEFEPSTCDFEHDDYITEANYYFHPWTCNDWSIEFADSEESEIDVPYKEPISYGAFCKLQENGIYRTKTIYKSADTNSTIMCIKNSGAFFSHEIVRLIEEHGSLGNDVEHYFIHENEGFMSRILPVVGIIDSNRNIARFFEIDQESGEIEMSEFENAYLDEFYTKLLIS